MQNTKPAGREGISYGRQPGVALLAALAAALVYFAASGLGTISRSALLLSPMGMSPLKVGLVVITSAIGAAVFALIGLFARRPLRLFGIIATVVLVPSFVIPTTVLGVPVATRLLLVVMHAVTWAVSVELLTALSRKGASV